MINFICGFCQEGVHWRCRGGNWCDCQHRVDNLWENLSARLTVFGDRPDVAYEATVGVLKLQEYINQAPVMVPIIPGI